MTIGVVAKRPSHQIASLSSTVIAIIVILSLLHLLLASVVIAIIILVSSLRASSSRAVASLSGVPDLVAHISHLAGDASALSSTSLVSIAILVATLSVATYHQIILCS